MFTHARIPPHTLISCAIFMTPSHQSLSRLLTPPPFWLHQDELYILPTSDSLPINTNTGSRLPPKSHPDTLSSPPSFACIVAVYQYVVETVRASGVLEQKSITLATGGSVLDSSCLSFQAKKSKAAVKRKKQCILINVLRYKVITFKQ